MTKLKLINGSKIQEPFAIHIFFRNKRRIESMGLFLFGSDPFFFFHDEFMDRRFISAHRGVDHKTTVALDDQRDCFAPTADELIDRDHNIVQINRLRWQPKRPGKPDEHYKAKNNESGNERHHDLCTKKDGLLQVGGDGKLEARLYHEEDDRGKRCTK